MPAASALQPREILLIANSDVNGSVSLAEYYCRKRAVPTENILKIPLGRELRELISRREYDSILSPAVRKAVLEKQQSGAIKCLLPVYGVPIKVGSSAPLKDANSLTARLTAILTVRQEKFQDAYRQLNRLGRQELIIRSEPEQAESYENISKHLLADTKEALKRVDYIDREEVKRKQYSDWINLIESFYGMPFAMQQAQTLASIRYRVSLFEKNELSRQSFILQTAELEKWGVDKKLRLNFYSSAESLGGLSGVITALKADIGRCSGTETSASIDSELSMVLYENYDLYRWQKNELQDTPSWLPSKTLMVCRLDGPSSQIASGLIDKAMYAEKTGLSGTVYIDARGLVAAGQPQPHSFEFFDASLRSMAELFRNRTLLKIVIDDMPTLFAPGDCPGTAIYCGWYSVKKYIDAFDFVPGAVGYHIASFEAMDLRNANSSNWCPAMLADGITATLGAVDEPYLHSFPPPDKFFEQLLDGSCLVEAFYFTNPFNSWQLVLLGDPLYKLNIK